MNHIPSPGSCVEAGLVSPEMLHIIEGEFEEMPGTRLTGPQFRRLFGLAPAECVEVTTALINSGVLAVDARGQYCRRADLYH